MKDPKDKRNVNDLCLHKLCTWKAHQVTHLDWGTYFNKMIEFDIQQRIEPINELQLPIDISRVRIDSLRKLHLVCHFVS